MATLQSAAKSAWKIVPQFKSRDIETTVAFFRDQLGFVVGGVHGPPEGGKPRMCSVCAGTTAQANIYFFKVAENEEFTASATMIALGTKQMDEFYHLLKAEGKVEVAEAIDDKPWGYRQFTILDPDGNRLTFFKFLEGGNPGPE